MEFLFGWRWGVKAEFIHKSCGVRSGACGEGTNLFGRALEDVNGEWDREPRPCD